ncbi:MAG TPA: cation:proton antiporter [Chloroflexota bacterium]
MFLVELAVVLVAAKLAGDLATRWGQPPVLGQLVAGLALGLAAYLAGSMINLEPAAAPMSQLANLGVILLMFLAGLETDWGQMRRTGKAAVSAAVLGVVASLAFGGVLALILGHTVQESLFIGVILTATSVGITAQTLMELGSLQTIEGATILGAAVTDDVVGLLVFSLAVAGAGASNTNLLLLCLALAAFFGACLALGGRVLPWLMRRGELLRSSEAPLALGLAMALVLSVAAENVGIAGITGAYLAGLLLNSRDEFAELTEKTKTLAYGLFGPVFLVKTGMDAHLEDLGGTVGLVLAMSAAAILAKVIGCGLGARLSGLKTMQSLVVGAGMVGRGEVTLIIASLALTTGLVAQNVFSAAVLVVVVTTLATPVLLRLALSGLHKAELGVLLPDAA